MGELPTLRIRFETGSHGQTAVEVDVVPRFSDAEIRAALADLLGVDGWKCDGFNIERTPDEIILRKGVGDPLGGG